MVSQKTFIVFILGILLTATAAFAAGGGGGGGGGVSVCSSDEWSCSDWSECSVQGKQTRTCQRVYDCEVAETPKPDEEASCTPACTGDTWTCALWSACSSEGIQSRACRKISDCNLIENPAPAEQQKCIPPQIVQPAQEEPKQEPEQKIEPEKKPEIVEEKKEAAPAPKPASKRTCIADQWLCGQWSLDCDMYGNHKRECKRTYDCPGVETQQPEAFKRCDKLQCGQLKNTRDRIECRLKLAPSGIARELEIEYLPEECKSYGDENKRLACIQLYKSFKPCWEKKRAAERFECARNIVGPQGGIQKEIEQCGTDSCRQEARKKVYSMITFRFYDLSERAEHLLEEGAPLEAVTDVVYAMETKKQEFNQARSKSERRKIILDARAAWREFVLRVKGR